MTDITVPLPGDPDRRTLAEICEALERSESTIYRYLEDGMPSHRYLGSRVFRWSEVVEWVSRYDPRDREPDEVRSGVEP